MRRAALELRDATHSKGDTEPTVRGKLFCYSDLTIENRYHGRRDVALIATRLAFRITIATNRQVGRGFGTGSWW
jgi:hypothetical protein